MTTPEASAESSAAEDNSTSSERIRRPYPDRTEPVRAASSAFHKRHRDEAGQKKTPSQGVADAAVDAAYRVYEEYLKWGQQAAARRPSTSSWSEPMKNNYGQGFPQIPIAPWLGAWQQMAQQWAAMYAQMMFPPGMGMPSPWGPNQRGAGFGQQPPPYSGGPPPQWGASTGHPPQPNFHEQGRANSSALEPEWIVRVMQISNRPLTLQLEVENLQPSPDFKGTLVLSGWSASSADGSQSSAPTLEIKGTSEGHWLLSVPDDPTSHPDGLYRGLIEDPHGQPRGMVTALVGNFPT